MKIVLTSENSVRLIPEPGAMTIEAQSIEQQYSPFHMLGSSLAFCTFSVLYSWATHVKLPVDDLTLDVSWEFAEDPHRVGTIALSFDWPSLPAKRINAAKRAAELCTIHATLMHSPQVTIISANEAQDMTTSDSTSRPGADAPRQGDAPRAPNVAPGRADAPPAREAQATRDAHSDADAPPAPAQQGDGQEAGTARPSDPADEATPA